MANLEKNYCRNPDNDANGLWCYVLDNVKEYCKIECAEGRSGMIINGFRWVYSDFSLIFADLDHFLEF